MSVSIINIYDEDDSRIGFLSAVSCDVTETLNTDDNLEAVCVYDSGNIWKAIKPGCKIGVYVERCVPVTSGSVNVFIEAYRTADDEEENMGVFDGPDEDAEEIGTAKADQSISIIGYNADTGRYQVASLYILGSSTKVYSKWVAPTVPVVSRGYYSTSGNRLSFSAAYGEQKYVVKDIIYGADRYTIRASHETIYNGETLVYLNDASAKTSYGKQTTLANMVSAIKSRLTAMGQFFEGNLISASNVSETAVVNTAGWAETVNGLLSTKLKEAYEYDILRSGNCVYLYNTFGNDRNVVLEVGRNLASMDVEISNEGGDLDGVYAYCTLPETEQMIYAQSEAGATPISDASKYELVHYPDAVNAYNNGNINTVRSKLEVYANAYMRNNAYKARTAYKITLTPELANRDDDEAETIVLGDIVTIRDPRISGGEIKKRVTGRKQDCITGKVTALTVGDLPQTLYDVIRKMT